MRKRSIILVGGGGHCKSAIDLIVSTGQFRIEGIVDVRQKVGESVLGLPIIASDEELDSLKKQYDCFAITIGQIQNPALRRKFFDKLISIGAELPVIVSPTAHVSTYSRIGRGTMIFHQSVVNADTVVGDNCIINNMALVEHDVVVQDHCHISTGAILNGNVRVGEGCFIGSNACIRQGLRIGAYAVIGAGSLVLQNVEAGLVVGGVPAQKLRQNG